MVGGQPKILATFAKIALRYGKFATVVLIPDYSTTTLFSTERKLSILW